MKKRPRTTERERTAYHEAGHAVMAFLHRRQVKKVSIVPDHDAGTLGHILNSRHPESFHPDSNDDARTVARCEREVLIYLGGPAAEAKFAGRKNHVGATKDYHMAIDMAGFVHGDPNVIGKYIDYLYAVAESTFEDPVKWWAVEEIAKELLERGEMSGKRARKVFIDQTYYRPQRDRDELLRLWRERAERALATA